jgi:hypothetical protein
MRWTSMVEMEDGVPMRRTVAAYSSGDWRDAAVCWEESRIGSQGSAGGDKVSFFIFPCLDTKHHRIQLFMMIFHNVISKPSCTYVFLVVHISWLLAKTLTLIHHHHWCKWGWRRGHCLGGGGATSMKNVSLIQWVLGLSLRWWRPKAPHCGPIGDVVAKRACQMSLCSRRALPIYFWHRWDRHLHLVLWLGILNVSELISLQLSSLLSIGAATSQPKCILLLSSPCVSVS